jgi:hypothetical protein
MFNRPRILRRLRRCAGPLADRRKRPRVLFTWVSPA